MSFTFACATARAVLAAVLWRERTVDTRVSPRLPEKRIMSNAANSFAVFTLMLFAGSHAVAQGPPMQRPTPQPSPVDPNKAAVIVPNQPARVPAALSSLVADVMERNPDLAALEQRIVAALARVPQAGALPDPMFEYGVLNEGWPLPFQTLGRKDFSEVYLGVTQEIPYPGKRGLRERVAQEDVEVERLRRDARVRELGAAVKERYLEIYGVQAMTTILDRNRRTLELLERTAAVRLGVGEAPQQDLLDAAVEVSRIEERLSLLRRRALVSEANLRSMAQQPVDWTAGTVTPVDGPAALPPLEELRQRALDTHPEIAAAAREASRSEFAVQLARRELKPDLGASFVYHNRGGFDPIWTFGGTLRIPLYAARKQRKAIEEAEASLRGAQLAVDARRLEVAFQVDQAYAVASSAQAILRLYDEVILKQANLALESALSTYQVGKIDFLTTLSSWIRLRDHELAHIDHVVEYLSALARLEALTGFELLK